MDMRIGFIGTGNFAHQHASILSKIGYKITACYGTNSQKTEHFCNQFNCHSINSPLDLITKKYIDILYIVIPPFAHTGEIELKAVEEKIPFFCEKPVGLNLTICNKISEEVKRHNLITSSGYLLRHEPLFLKIKDILQNQRISSIRICNYSYMPQVHWWRQLQKSGGMMIESGSHYIDLLRYLFGEINYVTAIASSGITNNSIANCNLYDSMESLIKFESGVIANFSISNILNNINGRYDMLEIYGEDFIMHIDLYKLRYKNEAIARFKDINSSDWQEIKYATSKEYLLSSENKNFLNAVTNNDPSIILSDYSDAVKTLKIALAMNEAAGIDIEMKPCQACTIAH